MKISKIVLSAAVVAGLGFVGSVQNVHASVKPNFNVYHNGNNIVLHSNTGKTMYYVEAVQNCVDKFGQFKTRHISFGVYFIRAGNDTITNHGYKYGIINDNWKHSKIYVTRLSGKQVYKIDHNSNYNSKGMKNTLQIINY